MADPYWSGRLSCEGSKRREQLPEAFLAEGHVNVDSCSFDLDQVQPSHTRGPIQPGGLAERHRVRGRSDLFL